MLSLAGQAPVATTTCFAVKRLIAHLNGSRIHKVRASVERFDTRFFEAVFSRFGERVCEAPFEAYQGRPVNSRLTHDAFALHAAFPIDHFSGADQHLLRIAAPQAASASKRARIDNGYLPTRRAAARGHCGARFTGSDYDQIKRFLHNGSPLVRW